MSDQLVFFAEPAVQHDSPQTSRDAAESVRSEAGWTEFRILSAFEAHGALTDDELVETLPEYHGPTIRTARSRLTKRGLLIPAGGTRLSARGRPQTIWGLSA